MAKKKNKSDLFERPVEEIQKQAQDLEKEIFAMRNERAMQKKLEKPHLLKEKRKERARILTFLTQNRSKAS